MGCLQGGWHAGTQVPTQAPPGTRNRNAWSKSLIAAAASPPPETDGI